MRSFGNYWAVLLLCAVAPAVRASQRTLDAFSAVNLCVPFAVQIAPGSGYSLEIDGDAGVESAITADVSSGVLSLGTQAFSTSNPIKVTIRLPAGALEAVGQNGLQASAFVASGFYGEQLSLTSTLGSGQINVQGANYTSVQITSGGTGTVRLNGAFKTVDLATSGITNTYLSGYVERVTLSLNGISNVYIVASTPDMQITGSALGISSVMYNQGQCSVSSNFPMQPTCQRNPSLWFQGPSQPEWATQLTASGTFTCPASMTVPAAAPAEAPTPIPPIPTTPPPPPPHSGPVPEPSPEADSYNFATPTPGGYQAQSGSAGPQGTTANSVAQGTNSASATSVAGPGGAFTSTSNDGTTNSATTAG